MLSKRHIGADKRIVLVTQLTGGENISWAIKVENMLQIRDK